MIKYDRPVNSVRSLYISQNMYCFRLCSKDFSLILMSLMLNKFLILWVSFAGRFISVLIRFVFLRYSSKMLQPSVAVTLRMHNAVFSFIGAPQMKAVTKS